MPFSYTGYAQRLVTPDQNAEQNWFTQLADIATSLKLDECITSETFEIMRAIFERAPEYERATTQTLYDIFRIHYAIFDLAHNGYVKITHDDLQTHIKRTFPPTHGIEQSPMPWLERECQNPRSPFIVSLDQAELITATDSDARIRTHFQNTCACIIFLADVGAFCLPRHLSLQMRLYALVRARLDAIDLKQTKYHELKQSIDFSPTSPDQNALNIHQQEAVLKALSQPLTIISGGPGTGKTSIVKRILAEAQKQGIIHDFSEVCLTAPTGKASRRIYESLTDDNTTNFHDQFPLLATPCTIHRLLHISRTHAASVDENTPLQKKLVIVDEISMIALHLGCALLQAVLPDANLVLIGDPDQLTPVEVGSLIQSLNACEQNLPAYRDQLDKLAMAHVTLQKNYRAKDQPTIFGTQNAIIHGGISPKTDENGQDKTYSIDQILNDCTKSASDVRFRSFEWITDPKDTQTMLDKWVDLLKGAPGALPQPSANDTPAQRARIQRELERHERVRRAFESKCFNCNNIEHIDQNALMCLFDHFEHHKLLSPKNGGTFGAQKYNEYLRKRLFDQKSEMPAGMLVMLTQNNYEIDHFNGDTGIIVKEYRNHETRTYVAFPRPDDGSDRLFDFFALIPLRTQLIEAFAISVHKSQGSQYEHVMIGLPPRGASALLTPNLLYTAVSRASQSATLIATLESVQTCIASQHGDA